MERANEPSTSPTLLGRLRQVPRDQEAWDELVHRYGGKIYLWCRHFGLREEDAHDVTQNVFLLLTRRLRDFTYDPRKSFRAWLKTVTHHAWYDFREGRHELPQCACAVDPLTTVEARDDLQERFKEEFDRELLEEALARVRLRMSAVNWEAFRLTALEEVEPAEAARRLGRTVGQVYTAKSRGQAMVREEMERLEYGSKGEDRA